MSLSLCFSEANFMLVFRERKFCVLPGPCLRHRFSELSLVDKDFYEYVALSVAFANGGCVVPLLRTWS